MTTDDADDRTLRSLRGLRVLEPDTARVERIRARCHERIARLQKTPEDSAERRGSKAFFIEAALLGGLSLIYVCGIVYDLLRLQAVR